MKKVVAFQNLINHIPQQLDILDTGLTLRGEAFQ